MPLITLSFLRELHPRMIKRRNFPLECPGTSDEGDQTIARFIQKDHGCPTPEFFFDVFPGSFDPLSLFLLIFFHLLVALV